MHEKPSPDVQMLPQRTLKRNRSVSLKSQTGPKSNDHIQYTSTAGPLKIMFGFW